MHADKEIVTLGRTKIATGKNAFGALPIQRVSMEEAALLLWEAYEGGITFFDTAHGYSDSEEKIGRALSGLRDKIYIATKSPAADADGFRKDLETSLRRLKTDYIDVMQFHNPAFCPLPGGRDGLYEAAKEAQKQGKIRFIGISNHRLRVAHEALESGLYDTLQFPFSYLAGEQELELVRICREKEVGFIAMKALSGGLITNARAAYAYMAQYDNVLPIWGIQRQSELREFLACRMDPPVLDGALSEIIREDRKQLAGDFCRGCGYCLPCPAEIDIPTCARVSLLIRRSPTKPLLEPAFQEKMKRVEGCLNCRQCVSRCPYGLDAPDMLQKNYADYQTFLA